MSDVALVGAGPGDERLLTTRAVELLNEATWVVCDPGPATALAERLCTSATITGPGRSLAEMYASGMRGVVRLIGGDALSPDVLRDVAALRRAGADVELVPGVATGPAVAAHVGLPTGGDRAGVVGGGERAARAQVRSVDVRSAADATEAVTAEGSLVLSGPWELVQRVLQGMLAAGRGAREDVLVVRRGATPQQLSVPLTLSEAARATGSGRTRGAGAAAEEDVVAVVGSLVGSRQEAGWFEGRALFGWRVLLPTTRPDVSEATNRIAELGGTSESVATVTVAPPRTPQQMDRAIHRMVTGEHAWIAFTAEGAVRAVRENLAGLGLDARALSGVKVATVTGETTDAVRAWGIEPDLVASTPGAQGLLADWPERDEDLDPVGGVLLPRAQIATETFAAGLAELGWEVDEVTAFRMLRADPPAPALRSGIKRGGYDAVLFSSAAGLRNFVGIAGKPHPTTVVGCIGPATARAAEEAGLRVDVVAHEPTERALVDGLAAYAAGQGQRERKAR